MSSRSLSNLSKALVVPALVFGLGLGVSTLALAAGSGTIVPPVQTYADQATPVATPQSQQYYDSPLAAGTLTLQDVLEAHRPSQGPSLPAPTTGPQPPIAATAPLLTPPVASSSTGLMMSQGMKAVLQKVGDSAVSPVNPVNVRAPVAPPQADAAPAALVAAPADVVPGVQYQPGQEPKNLVSSLVPAAAAPAFAPSAGSAPAANVAVPVVMSSGASSSDAAPVSSSAKAKAAADGNCNQNVQKWEKSCAEAGYPVTYVGNIVGETRTDCADGSLHDVWVTNTCAPADAPSGDTVKTDGVCGLASNDEFDAAPKSNLCTQGVASAVNGDGPWSWACSGINGGQPATCTAPTRTTLINGVCGAANGVAVTAAPFDDLCKSGSATAVKGSGPWTWNCKASGKGSSQSCIAPSLTNREAALPVAVAAPVSAPASSPSFVAAPAAAPVAIVKAKPAAGADDLCGPASETLAYEAPEKDLCRAGSASVVNGDGPWTWSCTNNEGVTSSCRTLSLSGDTAAAAEPATPQAAPQAVVATAAAPALQPQDNPFSHPSQPLAAATAHQTASVELSCGPAITQPVQEAPVSGLCLGGKASAVKGNGPWDWTCSKGHKKIACEAPRSVDAVCGAANGTALKSAPFSGLCAAGSPSGIEGTGPWSWTCNGTGGGVSVTCAATVLSGPSPDESKVDGACGASDGANVNKAPADGLCASGTPSAVSGRGPWTWSCSGTNGGAVTSCSAQKITPPRAPGPVVNGLCGAANGVMTSAQPSDLLCSSGEVSSVVGNGPWNWSCAGENGGMTVSCTAPLEPPAPIDGACGAANGVETLVRPKSALCDAGITGTVNGKGPWTWTCSGANGGNAASCVAPLAGKSGAIPSVMTTASNDSADMAAAPAAAPTGLVTPRLPSSDNLSSLDKKVIPSLTSSKAFATAPMPSKVPTLTMPNGNAVGNEPGLSGDDNAPVQPPALRDNLASAPVLQESAASAAHIPGNHLTLDPTISTILFQRGSGNIDDSVLTTLGKLANVLEGNPDVRISLIAYADNNGSTPRDARRLSLTRALAVRDYLESKGISQSRVDIHAEGANTTSGYIDRVDVKVNE